MCLTRSQNVVLILNTPLYVRSSEYKNILLLLREKFIDLGIIFVLTVMNKKFKFHLLL